MKTTRIACLIATALPLAAAAAEFGPLPPPGATPPEPPVAQLEVVDPRLADPRVTSGIHAGGGNPVDASLAEEVAERLAEDPRLDGATMTVVAEEGAVGLSGLAVSGDQGDLAQQLAREVPGVESVTGTLHDQGS